MKRASLATIVVSPTTLLAVLVAAQEPARLKPEPGSIAVTAPNPHWRSDGCAVCHSVEYGKPKAVTGENVDLLCLSCHDGTRAHREPHPIGRSFAGDQVRRPESWPTRNGLLTCITCHDILRGCRDDARRPAANPAMLRGAQANAASFCNECHVVERHQKHNPHAMLREPVSDKGVSCMFCHTQKMLAGPDASRSGVASLKMAEVTLCGQCHHRHMDFFTPGHIGVSATPAVLANIRSAGERMELSHGTSHAAALPLADGKVVCSTCHNPHQAGVFPESNVLRIGAMNLDSGHASNFALRIPGGQLCITCHGSITTRSR